MKIHQTKFITLVIWGLLTNLINFTFLCLVVFCCSILSWMVGGWVVRWGKSRLKTISAQLKLKLGLSLAIVYRWLTSCPLDKEFEDLLD